MNNNKDFKDKALTEDWLRDNGIEIKSFNTTDVKLLLAQKHAHALLNQHAHLLTQSQTNTVKAFQRKMKSKQSRKKLKPESAYAILNINTKINRLLYRLNKDV